MKVAILAGGAGTRLAEETELKPKPMVEIGGRPILWHIMKHYAHFGHAEFAIALGYKGEYIKRWMKDFSALEGDLTVNTKTNDAKLESTSTGRSAQRRVRAVFYQDDTPKSDAPAQQRFDSGRASAQGLAQVLSFGLVGDRQHIDQPRDVALQGQRTVLEHIACPPALGRPHNLVRANHDLIGARHLEADRAHVRPSAIRGRRFASIQPQAA